MSNKEIDAVFLDIDGTLAQYISWQKITESLGASSEEATAIFNQFREGKIKYEEAKNQLIGLWQATGNANKKFMEQAYRSWNLKEDAQEVVDYLKLSYQVCLISGAVDLYVQTVAEKLGVVDWFANTELIWDKQGNLIDFIYYPDQAGKKLEQFSEYATQRGFDPKRCAIVGDADSDRELFKNLIGIEINRIPNPVLKDLATYRIQKLKELRNIL